MNWKNYRALVNHLLTMGESFDCYPGEFVAVIRGTLETAPLTPSEN